jgi:NTP pyrophosphatase (non-canonical NTP hydrolase)
MSLSEIQTRVHAWISQYQAGYFDPLSNIARLSEEVGELAREMNHRYGQKTKKPGEAEGDPGMEMADIIFVLVCMANREGIDLQEAFDRMMEKVERRDGDRWTKKPGLSPRAERGGPATGYGPFAPLRVTGAALYSQCSGALSSSANNVR